MSATTESDTAELWDLIDEIKASLRAVLAERIRTNCNNNRKGELQQHIFNIPFDSVDGLSKMSIDDERMPIIAKNLDLYPGAALVTGDLIIPFPYRLHVMTGRRIEVLVLGNKLHKQPLITLANETARIASEQMHALDIDDIAAFQIPESVTSYLKELPQHLQKRFREVLTPRLKDYGFEIVGKDLLPSLTLRRNR